MEGFFLERNKNYYFTFKSIVFASPPPTSQLTLSLSALIPSLLIRYIFIASVLLLQTACEALEAAGYPVIVTVHKGLSFNLPAADARIAFASALKVFEFPLKERLGKSPTVHVAIVESFLPYYYNIQEEGIYQHHQHLQVDNMLE